MVKTHTHTPVTYVRTLGRSIDAQMRFQRLKWILPFLVILFPIVLLGVYSYRIASFSVRELKQAENLSATSNLSQLLIQDMIQYVALAHAVASVPGTIEAVRDENEVALRTRLKAIVVSSQSIDRAFVVSGSGVLRSEYPAADGAYGQDMSGAEWFFVVADEKVPAISSMYIRPSFPEDPVVAIAVPIEESNIFLGALVFEYRVRHISQWLENIRLGGEGYLYILDHTGTLIAHPSIHDWGRLHDEYQSVPVVREAFGGRLQTTEYTDPRTKEVMIATFIPLIVGRNHWVVVGQQPRVAAYALLNRIQVNIVAAGGVLTLFTLVLVVTLAHMSGKVVRLNEELQQTNQALKDFTSIVSHQLKAPVTAIRWVIENILDGEYGRVPKTLLSPLKEILATVQRNYELITDMLNVSRIDRGVVEVKIEDVPLSQIVDEAVRYYRLPAEEKGLFLRVEADDCIVRADKEKSVEAVGNSISNALKHTHAGGITVRIVQKENEGVVEVSDTGDGIPPDMLKRLFTRDQIRGSSARSETSAGLGLYVTKRFMELQHGDVSVSSDVGKGSTFIYRWDVA